MAYSFTPGWNLRGFPLGKHSTAASLLDAVNAGQNPIKKIQAWDGSGWKTYSAGAPFGDFAITKNNGYFLFSETPAGYAEACGSTPVCGAFIAPGVWKEFDCYNLAAIGKTTNDDPFTPSWRLIGGYWQWGRKGPDPSQWYNTNC